MKKKMKSSLLGIAFILLTAITGFSQCKEVLWPENKEKAEESVALYGDAMKQQNWRAAVPPFQWMLKNAPKWNTKLYIDGTEIYNKLASAEKDPIKKQVLVDSLMMLYDMRVTNCGDEVNVLNRKAIYAATYNAQNKAKTAEVLALYDKVYEISGNNVLDNNLLTYMQVIQLNAVLTKNLSDDQILERYDKLSGVIDVKIKKAQEGNKQTEVDRLKATKSSVDDILIKLVKVDCDFVKKNLEPKFKKNPNDIALAKKIFQFMTTGGCIEDPLWLQTAEVLHKDSPDYGLAINMAKIYAKNGNVDKAESLASEAITIAPTAANKATANLFVGDLQAQKGSKSAAREAYRKAIAADPSSKDGYEKIGDLYMGSFKDCAKGSSLAEDRLVYLAAYDMYAKAGDQSKMNQARGQFPSVTELFELNWKEGETKSISCWVGETVVLRTRGKE
ncbi:MAG: tetratricopeptide repeat protein [Cyclobacteriaceae bacterium]|jgi:tetratricopeptide (TPR) repeat protein|nr:tetratricopeptide repeat protein [Cyclobacteriaceae bacterium]